MRHPRAVLLDYGNTLATAERYDLSAGCARLCQLLWPGGAPDSRRVERAALELDAEIVRLRDSTPVEFTNRSFLRLLLAQLSIQSPPPLEQMEAAFWQAALHYYPEPGAAQALADLHAREVRLGVVSNCAFTADILRADLDRMGFSQYLEIVISSADYGLRKQHPLLFSAALALMKLHAGEVWYLGDSLQYDVAPARDAGMTAIWYNPTGAPASGTSPDAAIGAWSELPALLSTV